MDINQSSLFGYKAEKSRTSRNTTDSKSVPSSAVSKTGCSLNVQNPRLPDVKEGQILKGYVVDLRYNEVRIQLDPGNQVISARLSGDVPLSIGQMASFQVAEGSPDQLLLKYLPLDSSTTADAMILKALAASNLPLTDLNKSVVQELFHHNMPVDKNTIQNLIRLCRTNSNASSQTILLMYKNNIPVTNENIKQFEAYQSGTHQLLKDLLEITQGISKLPSSNVHEAASLNDKLIQILYPASETEGDNSSTLLIDVLNHDQITLLNNTLEEGFWQNPSHSSLLSPNLIEQTKSGMMTIPDTVSLTSKLFPELIAQAEVSDINNIASGVGVENQDRQFSDIIKTLLQQNFSGPEVTAALNTILNTEEANSLSDLAANLPGITHIQSKILDGTIDTKDLLTFIQKNIPQVSQEEAYKLLSSEVYQKLLTDAFAGKWTLTPEKLAEKDSVKELYHRLQEDSEKLSNLINREQRINETASIQEPIKNMQDNLQFLRDLNQMFTYVQLPVQLKEQNIHSDLYVFSKKNALKNKKDALSVLLHLDMANLGPINIHITMDHNNILAKFQTSDNDIGQLVTAHLPILSQALLKKGYQLHGEVTADYRKPDFRRDFIEEQSNDSDIKRYSFDIRT